MTERTGDLCDVWLSASSKKKVAAMTRQQAEIRRIGGRSFLQSNSSAVLSSPAARQTSIVQYMSNTSNRPSRLQSGVPSSHDRSLCTSSLTRSDTTPHAGSDIYHSTKTEDDETPEVGSSYSLPQSLREKSTLSDSNGDVHKSTPFNTEPIAEESRSVSGSVFRDVRRTTCSLSPPHQILTNKLQSEFPAFCYSSAYCAVSADNIQLTKLYFDKPNLHPNDKQMDIEKDTNLSKPNYTSCKLEIQRNAFDDSFHLPLESVDSVVGLADLETGPIDVECSVSVNGALTEPVGQPITDTEHISQSDSLVVASYKRKAAEFSMELDLMRKRRCTHEPEDTELVADDDSPGDIS